MSRLQRAGRRLVLVRLDHGALPFEVHQLPVLRVVDLGHSFGFEKDKVT
jgi:hypothetical protein